MTDFVSKISKPTKSADSTDQNDFSMDSNKRSLKVIAKGQWSHNAVAAGGPGQNTIVINHGLGYSPAFKVYGQKNPGESYMYSYPVYAGGATWTSICWADEDDIVIILFPGMAADDGTINGYYYIFGDQA